MALPDRSKIVVGTPIVVANSTYVPTVMDLGTITHDIDLVNLVAGTAREGAKIDFGANIDLEYVLAAALEWETSPEIAAGETVGFYMGWSPSAAAADDNPAALTGVDADYTGMAGGSLAGSLKFLQLIGTMTMDNVINTDTIGVQSNLAIATFTPRQRYGIPVVINNAVSAALFSDSVEMAFSFTPLELQFQD